MRKLIFLFCFLLVNMLFSLQVVGADEELIFAIDDPYNDDYGPGTYLYPNNEIFQTNKGLFDIIGFSIREKGEEYLLKFKFNKLTDPWKSKYGFSLPLIQLYIDNQEGGSTELFEEGANIKLNSSYPWDILLEMSGWWIRAYKPEDREKEDNFWLAEENPWEVKGAEIEVEGNDILLRIKKEVCGKLQNAKVFLIIGSFDPFGPGYFRCIDNKESSWNFADLTHNNLTKAPRVIDIVLPEKYEQKNILSQYTEEDYSIIHPLIIKNSSNLSINQYLLVIIFLIVLLLFIMNKKQFINHTKH